MAERKKTLVIVESPSKAKTIGKYLGSTYDVVASVGHVRDLPKSKLGIDIENNYEPDYISIRGKGDIIKDIKKKAKKAKQVYLATDPDREGEAISWHLAYLLGIDEKEPCRVTFNEITKSTVKESIKHPRCINVNLVDAQQARRVVDRLVGYQISPLLWRKVKKGLSAGRVQSAALKIVCDREKQIQAFEPKEYWNIIASFHKSKDFTAKLADFQGKKLEINNSEDANKHIELLKKGENKVISVERKSRQRKPYPPFTTSSLQQEASTKLGFNTRKTMMVAQQLYEGVDIKGHGTVGLVTYIRTDSVRVSDEAKSAAKDFILSIFGDDYIGNNNYVNKKKDIQDAHEAIRPSDLTILPDDIKDSITKEQYSLYKLVWQRFIASQMAPAVFDGMLVQVQNGDYTYKATGSKIAFDGYQKIYKTNFDEDKDKILPELNEGDVLNLKGINGEQNFTQPPSRFTEASLVKDLEEKNIGRPSTYAPIIATLLDRRYVKREKKSLMPTELGFVVDDLVSKYFKEIVDVGFTAEMEDKLDDVELNKLQWKKVVGEFYEPLKGELEIADKEIEHVQLEEQLTGEVCELCGKPMAVKTGRFGDFIACTGYPECKNTKPIINKTDVKCPQCGNDIIVRRSKRGKMFYGCSGYPECNQVFWYKPTNKHCPKCDALLVERKGKDYNYICSNNNCGYKES